MITTIYKVYDSLFNEVFSSEKKDLSEDCLYCWNEHFKAVNQINDFHEREILNHEYHFPLSLWEFQFDSEKIDEFKAVKIK